jgi:ABC-type transporter Mla MlaB component
LARGLRLVPACSVLKIQNAIDGDLLVVSGRLCADNLIDLAAALDAQRSRCALDLKDLVLVDADAVRFLSACERDGIVLRNCPPYIRSWMDLERTKP